MPIYEYVCEACDAEFEQLFRSFSEKRSVKCPECGNSRADRKFSTFAVSSPGGGGSFSSSQCSSCRATSCATCKC